MMRPSNRTPEILTYAGLWSLATALLLLGAMRARIYTGLPLLDGAVIGRAILTLLPMMLLFAINNWLLIPFLLKRSRYASYFLSVALLIGGVWCWQRFQFFTVISADGIPPHPSPPHHGPHPLLPLPLFLDVIYDVLTVGVNLAVSLLFQHFDDRLEHERLTKEHVEHQLTYLKAQINPHFYMNMLNNIHGMIEIDPVKAQDMVIEMSGLMRYMLYDSSRAEIGLSAEVGFIRDYLGLMRGRYPADIVSISSSLPPDGLTAGILVPPLLFLVFIENAFKHGVSYTEHSFISVDLAVDPDHIVFRCVNSLHPCERQTLREGIGLANVKRRMDIIYGRTHHLDIVRGDSAYSVTLTLPLSCI